MAARVEPEPVADTAPDPVIPDGLAGLWWVAHTRSRNEKALAADLKRMAIPHYLPLRRKVTRARRSGRLSQSTVPVFTGYLFFNATESQRYRVLGTNRVAKTLFVHEQEALVSQLRYIHQVLATGMEFEHLYGIQVGQWVRVACGPLRGIEGCVACKLGKARLSINVHTLGQSVMVEVDGNWLETIDAPEPISAGRSWRVL